MFWIIGLIIGLVVLGVILKYCVMRVDQQYRCVIERFGKYVTTFKPGLNIIFPGMEKVKSTIFIGEQTVPLFETPVKIDFVDGSAVPKNAQAFVKIKDPDDGHGGVYRATYEIDDWKKAIKDLLENAVRSYLNGLTIDEGITQKRAGFDLKNGLPQTETERIDKTLLDWGYELMRVTIADFDLDENIVKARDQVQMHHKAAEAAKFERETMALETMGALIQMVAVSTGKTYEEVQKEIADSDALKKTLMKFGKELVTRKMSLDSNALKDIRVDGAGSLGNGLLQLIAAFKSDKAESDKAGSVKKGKGKSNGDDKDADGD